MGGLLTLYCVKIGDDDITGKSASLKLKKLKLQVWVYLLYYLISTKELMFYILYTILWLFLNKEAKIDFVFFKELKIFLLDCWRYFPV